MFKPYKRIPRTGGVKVLHGTATGPEEYVHVVVTGAGGLSGARIVGELLTRGHMVTAVVRSGLNRLSPETVAGARCRLIFGDLAQGIRLPEDCNTVVHTAATSPEPGVGIDAMVHDNVMGAQRLAEECRRIGIRTMIHLSSLSVYGTITVKEVDEATAIIDPAPYGLTKRLAEHLLTGGKAGWRSLSLRLPGIIGPLSSRNWLSQSLETLRANRPLRLYNPHTPFNNAIHVEDLAQFIADLVIADWSGDDTVTLGTKDTMRVGEVIAFLAAATDSRSIIKAITVERGGFIVSSRRAAALYGFHPASIANTLHRFAVSQPPTTDAEPSIPVQE